ncbi:MAG: methyltransferase domain-containing protein [Candidatus Omnitrophica bacterium]|nr:methyltransferase domain-containing protein [Candidatus Omnitrophota bacterium]MBU1127929.1 methyltransferase domain-containing protein [Candidatus Omnitrophota bacterium]MBU1657096.1 methyltransferase domain-containing protein [Candidatus Omnitrophota bacterium]MBU1784298.1 methyltransferase domain-containing protein [Candidatus Omnitrophota bacterium]MBU1851612.1 methyltransferase domain-containing protein [Candidatus Omnitrophota bacterium]
MTNKKTVINNFSKNARYYDRHSKIQAECAGELAGMLPDGSFSNILEIGCGTGVFTRFLTEKYIHAKITAVDIAGNMLDLAGEKLAGGNVVFMEADGEKMPLDERFDLIASNASFQWFDDMNAAPARLANTLLTGGSICFSIYGPGTFREFQEVLTAYFGENRWLSSAKFVTREILERVLEEHFNVLEFREKVYRAKFPSLLDFLRDIKFSGTSGSGLGGGVYLGKDALKDLERIYREKFGGIIAAHQVFFCGAKKKGR